MREERHYDKAKELLEKSLAIHTNVFEDNNIRTGLVLFHLGNLYKDMGEFEKAKTLLEKSLIAHEQNYGKNHIETMRVLRSLGQNYLLKGHLPTAQEYLSKVEEIFQKNNHPDVYMVFEDLAELYLKKAMLEANKGDTKQSQAFQIQATSYLKQALEVVKTHFPKDSPHILRIQNKIEKLKGMNSLLQEKTIRPKVYPAYTRYIF